MAKEEKVEVAIVEWKELGDHNHVEQLKLDGIRVKGLGMLRAEDRNYEVYPGDFIVSIKDHEKKTLVRHVVHRDIFGAFRIAEMCGGDTDWTKKYNVGVDIAEDGR